MRAPASTSRPSEYARPTVDVHECTADELSSRTRLETLERDLDISPQEFS